MSRNSNPNKSLFNLNSHDFADVTKPISNFISAEDSATMITHVLFEYASIVAHTLGPRGTNNFIHQPEAVPSIYSTKDGHDSVMPLRFSETGANCIRDYIREIALYMNKEVGDSTTSGYPILFQLYQNLKRALSKDKRFKYISVAGIEHILKEIREYFINNIFNDEAKGFVLKLEGKTTEEKLEILKWLANISANNDPDIGEKVVKLFANKLESGEETAVVLERKNADDGEDLIRENSGYEIKYGISDEGFANQPDGTFVKFKNPKFLFFKGPVADSDWEVLEGIIVAVTQSTLKGFYYKEIEPSPLVIMADSFSSNTIGKCLAIAKGQIYREKQEDGTTKAIKVPIALVPTSCTSGGQIPAERFVDMALVTGATIIDSYRDKILFGSYNSSLQNYKALVESKLGKAELFEACIYQACIIPTEQTPEQLEAIEERIAYIKKQLSIVKPRTSQNALLFDPNEALTERMAMLKKKTSRIMVGGINLKEKTRRLSIFDDVVRAIQSAIKHGGVILGGNVSITHTLSTSDKRKKISKNIAQILVDKKQNIIPSKIGSYKEVATIVEGVLEILYQSFSTSYKYSIENAFKDTKFVNKTFLACMKSDVPVNYNILTDKYSGFLTEEKSSLVSPINTDKELMTILFSAVGTLLGIGGSMAVYPKDITLKDYVTAFRGK